MARSSKIERALYFLLILCMIGTFLLAGCAATKIYPKSNQGLIKNGNRVTLTQNKVSLTVLTNTWNYVPSDLDDYYTPIEVLIRNDQEHSIDVSFQDFLLFDEVGNQYRALKPLTVDNAMGYNGYGRGFGRYSVFMGFSYGRFSHPFFHDPFYHRYWYGYPYYYQPYYSSTVQRVALLPGEVRPHAQVKGFLYFQKISAASKDLILEWIVHDPKAITPTIISVKLGVIRSGGLGGGEAY